VDVGTVRRYTHSPVEVVDLRDVDGLIELLCAYLGALGAGDHVGDRIPMS
jgi:putative aminopeptidase FrvX